jgi:glyoxylase-like metal-dependent hydrolase (beta-lactamase superfamily II)/rhodanese-related sulfurtransferase
MADAAPATPSIGVGPLLERVDAGEPLLLLDVRNDEEFETWRFEGRRPIETVHIPYFDFIEDAGGSIDRLPGGREIVVLCAQGGSSAMVVDTLRDAGVAARNVAGGMVAYGEYLEPVKVPIDADEAARWEIWQVNRRGKGCLSYVVRSGRNAIVVDPSRDVGWYERFVRERLEAGIVRVLDTHVHADHLSGGPALAARSGAPYFVSAGEGFDLRHPVEPLADGQGLRLGGQAGVMVEVRIMQTPGHTPGSTSYLVGRRHLLTGDTVFVKSVGRPDLGGHVVEWGRALFHTLKARLAGLPGETVVLPAHFAGTDEIGPDGVVAGRLDALRRAVPELQIATEEAFVAALRAAVKPPPATYADIIRANLGLAAVDPDTATSLELGKNQCAASAQPAAR